VPSEGFEAARTAVAASGTTLTKLGEVTDGEPKMDGEPLKNWKELGWQHLRGK
jgi:thiamine monophosphate kinase